MAQRIVTVTKKGQATIPKQLREKHQIGRKALVVDTEKGVLLKPIPDPLMEMGSLKRFFEGKTSKEIMKQVRKEESERETKLPKGRSIK